MDAGGPGPLWEVRGLSCQLGASLPYGHVASLDPSPGGERVRGRWSGEEKGLTRGVWLLRPLRVVTDNYAGPALLQ